LPAHRNPRKSTHRSAGILAGINLFSLGRLPAGSRRYMSASLQTKSTGRSAGILAGNNCCLIEAPNP